MLYSAMTMRGVEIVGADGTRLGTLIDAYANTGTDIIETLIVDSADGQVRLLPTGTIQEYDTEARRLKIGLSAADVAGSELAGDGIPVMIPIPEDPDDAVLHVVTRVTGFMVQAKDGPVGQASDFLVDSDGLVVRFLVVDTRDWLPGADKLIPVTWVESVDWNRRRMYLRISQAKAKMCQRASAGKKLR